ncbi:MAG: HAD family hydrolase [Kiritimatiellia bacterium]|jgi:phosphoglycolate phosphatase
MNPVRHLVWDWNGTLLDDAHVCVAAINCLLSARGLQTIPGVPGYRERFVFPVVDYYRELGFDLPNEDWDALAREFHAALREVDDSRLRPDAPDVLHAVRSRGIPQSILSLCEQSLLERKLRECGVFDCFDRVRGVDNLDGASKLEVGRRLFAELALPPSDVLLVGDTLHDHEVAQALGCRCILVSCGHQTPGRLADSGRRIFATLTDVVASLGNPATP